jgi:CubicO group peptidase (beta-lactamase class C family)
VVIALGAQPALAQEAGPAARLLPAPVVPVPPLLDDADIERAIAAIDGVVTDLMASTGVPGVAVAVVRGDEVIHLKGFGVREVGRPEPIDADTVFLLASVSKPIASTVIAQLVGERVIGWDDPIVRHDPDFALAEPYVTANATFADMLSHRSGLHTGAGDLLEDLGFDRDTILSRLYMQPLDPFRSTYNYSNFGYTIAGVAAAKAAGKSWEDLAEEVLFAPLGMTNSSYRHADFLAHENRARIHVRVGNPADRVWAAKHDRQPDAEAPAGGASASIRDLAQYLRLQVGAGSLGGKPVVDGDALAVTHMPHILSAPPSGQAARGGFYGLGWNVSYDDEGRVRLGHSGAFDLGTATAILFLPGENLAVAAITNGQPIGVAEAIGLTFVDIAQNGRQTVDWQTLLAGAFDAMRAAERGEPVDGTPPPDARPARAASAYVGTYENAYYGPLEVRDDAGSLVMRLGPANAPMDLPLTHIDGDGFVFETIGENATGLSKATFGSSGDGQAESLALGFYDRTGLGTWTRR